MTLHKDLLSLNFTVVTELTELLYETHMIDAIKMDQAQLVFMLGTPMNFKLSSRPAIQATPIHRVAKIDETIYQQMLSKFREIFIMRIKDACVHNFADLDRVLADPLNRCVVDLHASSGDFSYYDKELEAMFDEETYRKIDEYELLVAYEWDDQTYVTSISKALLALAQCDTLDVYHIALSLTHHTIPVYSNPMSHQMISQLYSEYFYTNDGRKWLTLLVMKDLFISDGKIAMEDQMKQSLIEYIDNQKVDPKFDCLARFAKSNLCATIFFYQTIFKRVLVTQSSEPKIYTSLLGVDNHIVERKGELACHKNESQFRQKLTMNQSTLVKQLAAFYDIEEDIKVGLKGSLGGQALELLEQTSANADVYFDHLTNSSFTRQIMRQNGQSNYNHVTIRVLDGRQSNIDEDELYMCIRVDKPSLKDDCLSSDEPLELLKSPVCIHSYMTTEEKALQIIEQFPEQMTMEHAQYSITKHIGDFVQLIIVEHGDVSNVQMIVAPAASRNSRLQPIVVHKDMQCKVAREGRVYTMSPLQYQTFANEHSPNSFTIVCKNNILTYLGFVASIRLKPRQILNQDHVRSTLLGIDDIKNQLLAIQ